MSTRLDSHIAEAQAENIAFLVAHGNTLEQACERAGITLEAWQRRGHRQATNHDQEN